MSVVGALARSSDHNNYFQSFDYDGFANLRRVTDSLGNTLTTNTFNLRGMRKTQTDLTAGSFTYSPNALGQVLVQQQGTDPQTTFEYDLLGRLKKRIEPEGTSTWTWGTDPLLHNVGGLAQMAGPGYAENYEYDSIGRLQKRRIVSDATYDIDLSYSPTLGALDTITYPVSTSGYRLKLQYDYQNGHLLRVKDFNAPATVFWTADATDARGTVIEETLGNGVHTSRGVDAITGLLDAIQSTSAGGTIQDLSYQWDRVGNLTVRQDLRLGLTETFSYDNLHRLVASTGPDPIAIGYDARGNMTSRTGNNLGSGLSHTVTWTSYNLPATITSAASSSSSQFYYAPDRSRWKQEASYSGTAETTVYIGGLIEKVTRPTGTSWKHYIAGGSGTVALYTRKSDGVNEIRYLSDDHLGSTDTITDGSGAVLAHLSYGAFGERRDGSDWSGNPTTGDWGQIQNGSRHGFTSHEMLDNLILTHMNGRVYDQRAGRFLSPDPYVQAPGFTQSFNRYAYTFNNPLSFTDPSGFANVNPRAHGTQSTIVTENQSAQNLPDPTQGRGMSLLTLVGLSRNAGARAGATLTPPTIGEDGSINDDGSSSSGTPWVTHGVTTAGNSGSYRPGAIIPDQWGNSCGTNCGAQPVAALGELPAADSGQAAAVGGSVMNGPPEGGKSTWRTLDRGLSYIRRHLIDGTIGASGGGSLIFGPWGRDARLGFYISCCESPDVGFALTIGRPDEHTPNLMVSNSVSAGAVFQGEMYTVGLEKLKGSGSAINVITPVAGASAIYTAGFEGDAIGAGVGLGRGWGISATETETSVLSARDAFMLLFEGVDRLIESFD